MLVRTIILDLGNVIVPFDFGRAYSRMETICGLDRGEIRARIAAKDLAHRLESGQIAPQAFVDEMNGALGTRLSFGEFREIWVSIFSPQTLIEDRVVDSLRDRYRLLLLSNTNAIHFDWLDENYPILGHFHHRILSHEVGAAKPDPKIYAETLRHAVGRPEECFFADDIPEFVEGARKAGIDAEQFLGQEKLLADLRARGVGI